ncbi:hypothetical protein ACO1PF_07230 [Alkalibacterium sp. f15]|uniref:hypothetical protein n=1 Tax=Alkalibacterium sp. f15 TaxID=3414029 RepID=UPI003BF7A6B6
MKLLLVGAVLLVMGVVIFIEIKKSTMPDKRRSKKLFGNGMGYHLFDEHLILDTSIDEYRSLSDVEEESEAIVIAGKVSEHAPTLIKNEQGNIQKAYTLSDFKVKKVVTGHILNAGETFTLMENEAYDAVKRLKYHISGYEKMVTGRDYLLLLHRSENNPYLSIVGVNYGKIPLAKETSEVSLSLHSANTDYAAEILDRYNHIDTIRKQARCKFADYISGYK